MSTLTKEPGPDGTIKDTITRKLFGAPELRHIVPNKAVPDNRQIAEVAIELAGELDRARERITELERRLALGANGLEQYHFKPDDGFHFPQPTG